MLFLQRIWNTEKTMADTPRSYHFARRLALLAGLASLSACSAVAPPKPMPSPAPVLQSASALVLDADLHPLAGVRLRFWNPLEPEVELWSGSDGGLTLKGIKAGLTYRVELSGAGLVPARQYLQLPESSSGTGLRLRFFLDPARAQLRANVLNSRGGPVPGAVLSLADGPSAESDAEGRIELSLPAPAATGLTIKRQGYAPCSLDQDRCLLEPLNTQLRLRLDARLGSLGLSPEAFAQQTQALQSETRAAGYAVAPWSAEAPELDPARDLLWLAAPSQALGETELSMLRDFVAAGGKLVISTEWAGFAAQASESLRRLLSSFGLAPGADSLRQEQQLPITLFDGSHPLLTGLKALELYQSASVRPLEPEARLLAFSDAFGFRIAGLSHGGQAVLACTLHGHGKVVVLGDSSLWLDADSDGDGRANFSEADNARLWKNVLSW